MCITSAEAKTSKGAPFSICLARSAVAPKLCVTLMPLCFVNAAPSSVKASLKLAAAATIISEDSGADVRLSRVAQLAMVKRETKISALKKTEFIATVILKQLLTSRLRLRNGICRPKLRIAARRRHDARHARHDSRISCGHIVALSHINLQIVEFN